MTRKSKCYYYVILEFLTRICVDFLEFISAHTKLLVFWLVHGMPLWQSSCMDPIWPEFEIWKIFHRRPAEILAPWTPGVSHGTKIFGSKIFSYHPQMMLFYAFWRLVLQKLLKIKKNCLFYNFSLFHRNYAQIGSFSWFEHFLQNKLTKHIK